MPYADPAQQREYMRVWVARRRAAWFADKVCAWCGSDEQLELDHVDRSQKVDHRLWSWSQERREAELAKCQVLCHPCHLLKTELCRDNPSQVNGLQHGTVTTYRKRGCRCGLCRAASAAQKSAWRAKSIAPLV
jgi:hypothetical protein